MAKQQAKSQRSGNRRRRSQPTNGRSSSEKPEKYRFARNVNGEETVAEREYRAYAAERRDGAGDDPDVLLDVPVLKVDSIHLEVEDLDVEVSLQAKVLELLDLGVGVEAHLGRVKIDIKGVEAQALLKVRLDHVTAIVDRVMTTLDRNPDLVESIGKAVEQVGRGTRQTLSETGEAVDELGEGAEGALEDVGRGAGQAAGEIGEGANEAVGQVGEGAGQAAGQLGEGASEAVGGAGEAVGQAAGGLGDVVGVAGGGDRGDTTGPGLAKAAARTIVREVGAAASDEAKALGVSAARRATEKAKQLGERRRRRHAERYDATEAAMRAAEELGVDLGEVDGTGADGRITIGDVRDAAGGA